jgi:two-component sensor histidine kinase
MKKVLIIILFLITFSASSQEIDLSKIQKLKRKLFFSSNYDSLAKWNFGLFREYYYIDYDKSKEYLDKYYQLAVDHKDQESIGIYYYYVLLEKFNSEEYEEVERISKYATKNLINTNSIDLYLESIQIQMRALNFLNKSYKSQLVGRSVLKNSSLFESFPIQLCKINLYQGQSLWMDKNDSALYFYENALSYLPNYPNKLSLQISHSISEFYHDKEKLDSALKYAKIAWELSFDTVHYTDTDHLLPAYNYHLILKRLKKKEDAQEVYNQLQIKRYLAKKTSIEYPHLYLRSTYLQYLNHRQKISYIVLFCILVSILIIMMIFFNYHVKLKKNRKKLEESLQLNKLLLSETNHRVKNNFQMMMSILNVKEKDLSISHNEFINFLHSKISSMAKVHELLLQQNGSLKISADLFFTEVIASINQSLSLEDRKINLSFEAEDCDIDADKMIILGVVINELVTNSVKHAFTNSIGGNILFTLVQEEKFTLIIFKDNGLGTGLKQSQNCVSGLMIVESLIKQIHGNIEVVDDDGLTVILSFKSKLI